MEPTEFKKARAEAQKIIDAAYIDSVVEIPEDTSVIERSGEDGEQLLVKAFIVVYRKHLR